jgi:hypothetical protein
MANSKQIKVLKERFRQEIEDNKSLNNLVIKNNDENNYSSRDKTDISKLIKCSQNYFEDLIKVFSNDE